MMRALLRPLRDRLVGSALLVIGVLAQQSSYAFSCKQHGAISTAAFALLPREGDYGEVHDSLIQAFVQGSMFEDRGYRLVHKWFNQHFHRADWSPPHRRSSCVRRFNVLSTELDEAIKAKDTLRAWSTAGKLAHYLQDMNCPPHVVPVWHAGGDAFDQTILVGNNAIDEALAREWSTWDLSALLDTLSLRTFASIREPLLLKENGAMIQRDWSLFWTAPVGDRGFGSYGEVGKAWGQPRLAGANGRTCEIAVADYQAYYDARWSSACTATVALIIWVQRRLGE